MYAIRSSRSVAVRVNFGIDGCEVRRKTLSDSPVADFIAAILEKEGVRCGAV
jgi:hypothetical protein